MLQKRVTAILYGSDRRVWRGGDLELRVTDIFAEGGPRVRYEGDVHESTVDLNLELPFDAGQMYAIAFSAPKHRPAWRFIRQSDFFRAWDQVEQDELILRLMLVPDAAGTSDLANGFGRLVQMASPFTTPTGIDATTFAALTPAAQMAFLNIEAKLRETMIDGAPVLSFVRAVHHAAVDRVFLSFDAGLKARMPRWKEFAGAPGHGAPKGLGLPAHPDSWKHTRYPEGNVQVSFSADAKPFPEGSPSLVHSADVDIDLGRGAAHAQEWLVNNVFRRGHKTDQTLVYGLLYNQGILPQYTLDPLPSTTRAMPGLRLVRTPKGARGRRPRPAGQKAAGRARKPKQRKTGKRTKRTKRP